MSQTSPEFRDQLDDFLIQNAITGLSVVEHQELDQLIQQQPAERNADEFEMAVAALDVAFQSRDTAQMPDSLKHQVIAQAAGSPVSSSGVTMTSSPSEKIRLAKSESNWSSREKLLGLATAASLLLAMFAWFGKPLVPASGGGGSDDQVLVNLFDQRDELLKTADVRQLAWTKVGEELVTEDFKGEVVWSDAKQQGFMSFQGLAINDPAQEQYQLWIFDTARDDALPVDGGVFDISQAGEVIVPIDAKLNISQAKMFAITVEKPGGVVQSKREILPLLAQVDLGDG